MQDCDIQEEAGAEEMTGWATRRGHTYVPKSHPSPTSMPLFRSQQPCLYHLLAERTPSGGDPSPASLRHSSRPAATRVQMYRYVHGPDPQDEGGDLWVYDLHTNVHMHTHALCNFPMSPGKPLGNPQLQHPWSQLTPFLFSSGHRSSSLQ